MSVKAGVWIDHRQAILVLITGAGKEIKTITSGNEGQSGAGAHHSQTPNDMVPEDRLERKIGNLLKDFYDEVIVALKGTEAVLILGPGEAKGEFHKRLDSKKLSGLVVEVETADKMTEGQLAAKVTQHFAAVPA